MDSSRFSERAAIVIGAKVRKRRAEDGLTEEAICRALGCNVDHLRAAETGEINFTAENIVGLCQILRVTPSWFFEGLV